MALRLRRRPVQNNYPFKNSKVLYICAFLCLFLHWQTSQAPPLNQQQALLEIPPDAGLDTTHAPPVNPDAQSQASVNGSPQAQQTLTIEENPAAPENVAPQSEEQTPTEPPPESQTTPEGPVAVPEEPGPEDAVPEESVQADGTESENAETPEEPADVPGETAPEDAEPVQGDATESPDAENGATAPESTGSATEKEPRWTEAQIVEYMTNHPQRGYFSRLFRSGGFDVGMEVGVASGRFSEHFFVDIPRPWTWHMVEPFPNEELKNRLIGTDATFRPDPPGLPSGDHPLSWHQRSIGGFATKHFYVMKSGDPALLGSIEDESLDFVYLDGDHSYKTVQQELPRFYPKVRRGGVLAGHDYCDRGDARRQQCVGCEDVPLCGLYTEVVDPAKIKQNKGSRKVANQRGVVEAVQEFMATNLPTVPLYHTMENFTRESLKEDGLDYDLIITNTRNPSWYLIKPAA